ncbi:MAG: hypothetical protein RL115_2264, partial [Bacteroidota bacterium]
LVYVPTEDELESNSTIDFENLTNKQKKRIYKFTDGSGVMANFIPVNIATVLFNMNKDKQKKAFGKEMFSIQNEIGVGSQGSKNENAITGEQIKSICIKLNIDRLGNISPFKKKFLNIATEQQNILSEPVTLYQKRSLKTFSTFEEADEENARINAQLSPEEHIKNVTERIQKIHADELKNPMNKKLKFRN